MKHADGTPFKGNANNTQTDRQKITLYTVDTKRKLRGGMFLYIWVFYFIFAF